LKNIALCASALVTLLNTWVTFFNHKSMYVHYNTTVAELRHLRADLDYLLCQGIDNVKEADLDAVYSRYQAILESATSTWSDLRRQQSSSSSKN
jgi:predicted metal-dependent phosphoesterase TrpH